MYRATLLVSCAAVPVFWSCLAAAQASYYDGLRADLTAHGLPPGEFLIGESERETFAAFRGRGSHLDQRGRVSTFDPSSDPAPGYRGFGRAYRLEARQQTPNYWSLILGHRSDLGLREGDVFLVVAEIRSGGSREANTVSGRLMVKDPAVEERGKLTNMRGWHLFNPTPEWRRYYFPFRMHRDPVGETDIELFFGGPTQVIEVGGIAVINFGGAATLDQMPKTKLDTDYPGRTSGYDDDVPWLDAARQRIAEHRMADLSVQLIGVDGRPVPGAQVRAEMTKHAFRFGSLLRTPYFTPGRPVDSDMQTYRDRFLEMFNTATIQTFKYKAWSGAWPEDFHPPSTLATLQWAHDQGLWVHGHTPLWHQEGEMPVSANDPPARIERGLKRWLHELMTIPQVREQVDSWDVINHPFAFSEVWRSYGEKLGLPDGGLELHLKELDWAERLAPDAELWVNEGNVMRRGGTNLDRYRDYVTYLLEHDAPLDGVGFMCHFSIQNLTGIEALLERFGRYAVLDDDHPDHDLRLFVTEFDVSADWSDADQVAAQADYARDFYTAVFSTPEFDGLIAWGFWEPAMWIKSAAWYTKGWELRPHGREIRELILERWWTDESATTGEDGRATLACFKGDHRVTVTWPDGTLSVHEVSVVEDTPLRLEAGSAGGR